MASLGRLTRIAEGFAAAALDPTRWDAAMEVAAETTGSLGAALFRVRGRLSIIPQSREMAASFDRYVKDGWIERDERYRIVPSLIRQGVATDFDFISEEEMAHHPYYQEFLRPCGLRWFAGVKVASNEDLWCLSIQRTIEQPPFSPQEQRELAHLSQHLSGAAVLARSFGLVRAEAALEAFESSGSAVVLINGDGNVFRMNRQAEKMLGPDLAVVRGKLSSIDRQATASLDGALHSLIRTGEASALLPPIILPRVEGRPILAYPSRPVGIASDVFAPCQAIVVLLDLAQPVRIAERDLAAVFDLTPTEARIAAFLAAGGTIEMAAKHGSITYESARTVLKTIFQKTGVHKQSELVGLLARFQSR